MHRAADTAQADTDHRINCKVAHWAQVVTAPLSCDRPAVLPKQLPGDDGAQDS